MTQITSGTFITAAQAVAGLKFTPTTNSTAYGSFTVQESTSSKTSGLGGPTATASIAVNIVLHQPSVTNATTSENTQTTSGLVITPNATDAGFVTYFQITSITGGTLYQNDGVTAIANGTFITAAQGAAGLKFTPTANSTASGSFTIQESTSATTGGRGGSTATATITVNRGLNQPSVTNATTTDNTQTTSGLVITPNSLDTGFATYFQITNITGGTLYQNDGVTAIANGAFISVRAGSGGTEVHADRQLVDFRQLHGPGIDHRPTSGLGGPTATATITVNLVLTVPA